MSGERAEIERETENPKQSPCCQCRTQHRAWTHETMRSWPEWKPRVRHLTTCAPQVPLEYFSNYSCDFFLAFGLFKRYFLISKNVRISRYSIIYFSFCHVTIRLHFKDFILGTRGMISWLTSLSTTSGCVLTAQSLEPASDSVIPPSLSAPPLPVWSLSLSLSQMNKH